MSKQVNRIIKNKVRQTIYMMYYNSYLVLITSIYIKIMGCMKENT